jgi:hypothetical protein
MNAMNRSFSAVLIGLGQRATRGCLRSPSLAVLLAGMAFPSAQAMDLDPQLVGQWPGNFQAVALSGQYAYVAALSSEDQNWRGGLEVLDVSDPFNPRWIGRCDTRLSPNHVTISKHFAYVMTYSGDGDGMSELEIIDISDPADPQPVGLLPLPVTLGRLVVSGNYVFLAAGKTGLQVIDVSDPRNPQPIAHLPTGGSASDVALLEGYAFIADYDTGLHVADVRDPANPRAVGRHVLNGGSAWGVCVAGSHAYVIENIENTQPVGNTYAGKYAMNVLDISDPSNPQMISSYSTRYQWNRALTVSGSFAYVSTSYHDSGWSEIEIIDLNNPVHPVRAGAIIDYGNEVVVSDRYAYVTGAHALRIFEINPANPARVGQYSFGDGRWATRVAVSDGYAYVANMEQDDKERHAEARLRILDIRDATNPVPVGFYATGVRNDEFSDIVALEGYAYLATTHQSDPPSIIVLDIRDPGNPQRVGAYSSGSFSPGSFEWGGSLAVSKGFLYLGLSATFRVLNASDPANPSMVGTLVGTLDLAMGDAQMAVSGDYAYLASGRADHASEGSLHCIDVTNPARPERAGVYATGVWDTPSAAVYAKGIAVSGGYAYAVFDQTWGRTRLVVIDVTIPASPSFVANMDLGRQHTVDCVVAKGNYLYVGGVRGGLQVFDVRDPSKPRRVGGNSALSVHDLVADGDKLYVADGGVVVDPGRGLVVLNLFRPGDSLSTPRFSPDGSLLLTISGETGSTARLQRSTNLRDWEDWVIQPVADEPTEIGDPDARTTPYRFYRALESDP